MKTKLLWLLALALLLVAVGCGSRTAPIDSAPAQEGLEGPSTPDAGTAPSNIPRATITPSGAGDQTESYPAPVPPLVDQGYPPLAQQLPRADAYPAVAGHVWMSRPAGEQCAEVPPQTLDEALSELQGANVEALTPNTANMMVCEACGCPTSLHFWAQIPQEAVKTAESLGWQVIEQ